MRILLDTHILIWAVGGTPRLGRDTLDTLSDSANDVMFSAVNIWEIAIKFSLRRPDFAVSPDDILRAALQIGFVELPVTSATAALVADLPPLHRDPFDRILVAQAIAEPAILYTSDTQLLPYSQLVRQVSTHEA